MPELYKTEPWKVFHRGDGSSLLGCPCHNNEHKWVMLSTEVIEWLEKAIKLKQGFDRLDEKIKESNISPHAYEDLFQILNERVDISKYELRCYYMNDNHTFSPMNVSSLENLFANIETHEQIEPCGMLCHISILCEGKEIATVGGNVHSYGSHNPQKWKDGFEAWKKTVSENHIIKAIIARKLT